MNIRQAIELYGSGTSEGAKLAWESREHGGGKGKVTSITSPADKKNYESHKEVLWNRIARLESTEGGDDLRNIASDAKYMLDDADAAADSGDYAKAVAFHKSAQKIIEKAFGTYRKAGIAAGKKK